MRLFAEKRKLESEHKQLLDRFELLQADARHGDKESKRLEYELGQARERANDDANLICKLQAHIRQMIARIEELEAELEAEQRAKSRVCIF